MSATYTRRFTGEVKDLAPNEIFVFNSYSNGLNKAGTAKAAVKYHGAQPGIGEGPTGQCYAIPSEIPYGEMYLAVERFLEYAIRHPQNTFLVTPIGCGKIFKRDVNEMATLFQNGLNIENIILPEEFVKILVAREEQLIAANPQPAMSTPLPGLVEIVKGDITKLNVDVIVNAANEWLWAGGGVCGAIHSAAGPALEQECLKIGHCDTGKCVMTGAYNINNCKKIIHAVGPRWMGGTHNEAQLLASCYTNGIKMAYESGYGSIAFPFISSKIFGYPVKECAKVAFTAVLEAIKTYPVKVVMCAFDNTDFNLFNETLKSIKGL